MNRVSEALSKTGPSIKSLVKLIVESGRATVCGARPSDNSRIIIMGNGPSLNDTIAEHAELLRRSVTMAVNFAANAEVFFDLQPAYYILVDPHFFSGADDANLNRLMDNLAAVSWPMTLLVPVKMRHRLPARILANKNIKVVTVNAVGIEGWRWLTDMAYRRGWGMPRPRNVLIPAIMSAVQMGFKEIYVVGADHSWMSTISVNERNEVVSIQPHFYKEDDREVKRINTAYLNYPLHQIVESFAIAFKAYHGIQDYARRHGVNIYNATPGSFIDAFDRRSLTT